MSSATATQVECSRWQHGLQHPLFGQIGLQHLLFGQLGLQRLLFGQLGLQNLLFGQLGRQNLLFGPRKVAKLRKEKTKLGEKPKALDLGAAAPIWFISPPKRWRPLFEACPCYV